jgi:NAD(P)-dependent dehydrogenase (short-subunit alcohol dehydrogenase family)
MNAQTARRAEAPRWTEADIPDQTGRTVVVTGASSGIGFEAARVLARHGATVVLACRDAAKAGRAAARIRAESPAARLDTVLVDMAAQTSVRHAAGELRERHPRLDVLVNNAGALVRRHAVTEDGFETTLATNHLGAFAFTGLVLDLLLATPGSRVVAVSSVGHKRGIVNFDDLQFAGGYRSRQAYFQSKLANLLFTYELHRRLAAGSARTIAVAAHPGNARTAFGGDQLPIRIATSPRARVLTGWLLQDADVAALSIVRAAVDPTATGGEYYGPDGRHEFTGYPTVVQSIPLSHDRAAQQRLWTESERLTGVEYAAAPSAPIQ